jgi:hypothetical protein
MDACLGCADGDVAVSSARKWRSDALKQLQVCRVLPRPSCPLQRSATTCLSVHAHPAPATLSQRACQSMRTLPPATQSPRVCQSTLTLVNVSPTPVMRIPRCCQRPLHISPKVRAASDLTGLHTFPFSRSRPVPCLRVPPPPPSSVMVYSVALSHSPLCFAPSCFSFYLVSSGRDHHPRGLQCLAAHRRGGGPT